MNSLKTRHESVNPRRAAAGFSLVEVMVALVVLSIGLLGIAKMQALGLSSNAVAGKRALAAIAADGLAAAMHENRAWWALNAAAIGTVTYSGTATGAASCKQAAPGSAAPCTPQNLALYDLQNWAQNLNGLLPGYTGTVTCQASTPVTCLVTITWSEQTVAVNTQGQAAAQAGTGTNVPTYTLFVQP